MKIIKLSSNKANLSLSYKDWITIGTNNGWINESKKNKEWDPNPFAVCTRSVGREDKEKYESCVMQVKKKQK